MKEKNKRLEALRLIISSQQLGTQEELLESCGLYKKMWEAHCIAKDEDADTDVFSGKETVNA